MTDELALGGELWTLGGVPGRVLDELERAGATADRLIAARCPDDLVASAAIDELTRAIDLRGALDRARPPSGEAAADAASGAAGAAGAAGLPSPSRDTLSGLRTSSLRRADASAVGSRALSAAGKLRGAGRDSTPGGLDAGGGGTASAAIMGMPAGNTSSGIRTSSLPAVETATGSSGTRGAETRAGAAAARAWLAAKAARTGVADVLDQPLANAGDDGGFSQRSGAERGADTGADAAVGVGAAATAPIAAASGPATALDRIAAVIDRLGSPGRPRAANLAARARAPIAGIGSRALEATSPGRAQVHDPAHDLARAFDDAADLVTTALGPAITPVRPASRSVARATPGAAMAPDAVPPARDEPPLAEPPASALRRFALLAESPAPPSPGVVETTAALGPRDPAPVAPSALALDDVELAECFTRILRREARRDGIDLEPPP